MLDRVDPPPFLVEHAVVDDAADRQLAVHLDRIIFEVFVAAIAVHDETPVGIAFPDSLEQRKVHRGAFDVERFVVLDDGNRTQWVERAGRNVDHLAKHFQIDSREEFASLASVGAFAIDGECERLEA